MDLVTDPRIGLPRKKTWLPSVKEVYDACEEEERPMREEAVRQANIRAALEARKEPPRENRPTLEQLRAKYGENWGMKSLDQPERKPKPAPTKEELAAHYREYGLAFQPKHREGADSGKNEAQDSI